MFFFFSGYTMQVHDPVSDSLHLHVVPAFNANIYGSPTFAVVAPLLWNSLPQLDYLTFLTILREIKD